jgi:undecaprenyl diphosphate synthase
LGNERLMATTDTPTNPNVPRHVAIVMDGNGRWAKKRFLPRTVGHKAGVEALVSTLKACSDRGIEHLTVFAFSSENWKRPEEEVSGLMSLLIKALGTYLEKLTANGARIRVAGDISTVSEPVRKALSDAVARTAHNKKITLTIAFNYGGRWDIVQACRRAMLDGVAPEALNEAVLGRYMAMGDVVDPDLLIRTGGEMRLSNFLLWQSAYSELYFTDRLWPDFDEAELDKALRVFALRERRFGDVGSRGVGGLSTEDGGVAC